MAKPTVIRVGICGCLNLYHGDLGGRGMNIGGHPFRLEEIRLPDEMWHTASIKTRRCHFFIDRADDVDDGRCANEPPHIFLERHDLVLSSSKRSEKLVNDTYFGMRGGEPKTPLGIARQIRGLIAEMSQRDRRAWLRRMDSPPPSDRKRK